VVAEVVLAETRRRLQLNPLEAPEAAAHHALPVFIKHLILVLLSRIVWLLEVLLVQRELAQMLALVGKEATPHSAATSLRPFRLAMAAAVVRLQQLFRKVVVVGLVFLALVELEPPQPKAQRAQMGGFLEAETHSPILEVVAGECRAQLLAVLAVQPLWAVAVAVQGGAKATPQPTVVVVLAVSLALPALMAQLAAPTLVLDHLQVVALPLVLRALVALAAVPTQPQPLRVARVAFPEAALAVVVHQSQAALPQRAA